MKREESVQEIKRLKRFNNQMQCMNFDWITDPQTKNN